MKESRKLYLLLFVGFMFRFFLSFVVWHPDLWNHMDWGERFFQYGAGGFFAPESNVWDYTWPNQPPGTIYIYAFIYKLFGVVFQGLWWLNVKLPLFPSTLMLYFDDHLYPAMLKLPAILSDLGIGLFIYLVARDQKKNMKKESSLIFWVSVLWIFNPVVWYNSAVWGQTDSVISFVAFLAFYLLLKKRFAWSMLVLAMCFYIKASLLIFVPLYLLMLVKSSISRKELGMGLVGTILMIALITIPFSKSEPFSWLYWLYTEKILGQQLQVITANAFNIWAALTGIHEQPHTLMLGPLSYQLWGYLFFGAAYGWILWKVWRIKQTGIIWWGLAMTAFSAFMLLTNMHERYLFPLFPFFTIVVIKNKKLLPYYLVVSLVSLLNLYNFWWVPKIGVLVDIMSFGNRLMPRVLGLVNFIIFLLLFKETSNDQKRA